ncbi:MAG: hypothetical protein HYU74_03170 [Dechloromonas sp.]|nr:hypothetical protein [Dechloromonas sp.]
MAKILDMNPITSAAAWLIEQTGDADITPDYLVEQCRLGEIKIFASVPEWKDTGDGEIKWLKPASAADSQKATYVDLDGRTWMNHLPPVSAGQYISDGLLLVTREMATKLLTHGKSSLSCARLKVLETGNETLARLVDGEPMIIGEQLTGAHDGRMVDFSHLRVSRPELEAFAKRQHPVNQKQEPVQQPAVAPPEILKRKALISEVKHFWPSIVRDLQDSSRNGLTKTANHPDHGYWMVKSALSWAQERGKISKEHAKTFTGSNPDSILSPMLRHLLKLN